jgi:hypothetical protein
MYLIEAKRRKTRRSDKAKKAIIDSLNKVKIKKTKGSFRVWKCKGYAYTKIGLKDIVHLSSVANQ